MRKRLMAALLVTMMVLSLTACGGGGTTSADTDTATEAEDETVATEPTEVEEDETQGGKVDQINITTDAGSYVYKRHEVTTDYEGNPALIVYFDWTNTTGETAMDMTFYSKVFQNGVECDIAILSAENEAISNATKEIQDGITLEVAHAYALTDTTSTVTLEVSELMSFDDANTQEQELALQ